MSAIAAYIHSKGLKAGIYTDAGANGCGYYYPTGRPAAANTGSEGHYDQDMLQFSQWGFDFVKVDWCGGDAEGLDAATAYKAISASVTKATATTGRALTLSICNWGYQNPWNWAPASPPCTGRARTSSTTATHRRRRTCSPISTRPCTRPPSTPATTTTPTC